MTDTNPPRGECRQRGPHRGAAIAECVLNDGHAGRHETWDGVGFDIPAAVPVPADTDDVYRAAARRYYTIMDMTAAEHMPMTKDEMIEWLAHGEPEPGDIEPEPRWFRAAIDAARAADAAEIKRLNLRVQVTEYLNAQLCAAVDKVQRLAGLEADTILRLLAERDQARAELADVRKQATQWTALTKAAATTPSGRLNVLAETYDQGTAYAGRTILQLLDGDPDA